jgi:hypothetical protein
MRSTCCGLLLSLTLFWDVPDPAVLWTFIDHAERHTVPYRCQCPARPCLLPDECLPEYDCICPGTSPMLWRTAAIMRGEPSRFGPFACADEPGSCCFFRWPTVLTDDGRRSGQPAIGPDFTWGRP